MIIDSKDLTTGDLLFRESPSGFYLFKVLKKETISFDYEYIDVSNKTIETGTSTSSVGEISYIKYLRDVKPFYLKKIIYGIFENEDK